MEMEVGFIYYFHFISVSVFFHFCIISHNWKARNDTLIKMISKHMNLLKASNIKTDDISSTGSIP